ncbi:MAG: hypothetical protein ACI8RZ_002441 [Myxococcota bacterium]|jgi:hypothetical protein
MMTQRLMPAILLALLTAPAAQAGQLETVIDTEGKLDKKDQALANGEWADIYTLDLQAGDRVLVEMESKKVDTYLVLRGPDDTVYENDDDGGKKRSALDVFVETPGTWLVYATSFAAADKGKYSIRIQTDRSGTGGAVSDSDEAPIGSMAVGTPVSGTLASGDFLLPNAEWADRYTVVLQAGEHLSMSMASSDIDTYIVAQAPSGSTEGNDDCDGDQNRSCLDLVAQESGEWLIYATSYGAADDGSYTLSVDTVEETEQAAGGGAERWSGTLADGDITISSGEFIDGYVVQGTAGERWVVDLRSTEFDPFLIVRAPDQSQEENDDWEGARDRSLLDITLDQTGEYGLAVTTYQAGEMGSYDLTLRRVGAEDVASADSLRHTGTLADGDDQLSNDEWYDSYNFQGLPGQTVRVDLQGEFDTYVGVIGPGGFKQENDDYETSGHSLVEGVLSEAGEYTVIVTSYEANQGGSYTLNIAMDEEREAMQSEQRNVTALGTDGIHATGTLESGDATLETGEFQDRYVFDAQAGQSIVVSMTATDFDPYIGLQYPDGTGLENDDWDGNHDLSRIEVIAPETGRYRVIATSYRADETGSYQLDATVGAPVDSPTIEAVASATGGEIYGVFVGISDYPDGGPGDLDFTAQDASQLYDGMQRVGMDPSNGYLLTDSDATRANVLSAIAEAGAAMNDNDLLMVFYSGHGGRVESTSFQAADPDGFDETLALYDGQITDDEVDAAFDGIEHGRVLFVLDSCFSGGFSKDVISQPGRMGLFSSQEDVTSAVARKFRAGGYLSRFMVEAVGERLADDDNDGSLTALELSQYVYERYRSDVKSDPGMKGGGAYDDIVMAGRYLGYQQLVVDRGGVAPSAVLFAW